MIEPRSLSACPSDSSLEAFLRGSEFGFEPDSMAEHLAHCVACRDRAAVHWRNLDDPLIVALAALSGELSTLIAIAEGTDPLDAASLEAFLNNISSPPLERPAISSAPETDALLGQRIGEYDVVRRIGRGGMGTVYHARHRRLDRDVAIKVLATHLAGHPEAMARFEREMWAAGKLNHPNIVNTTDAGNVDGAAYIAMELLDGDDLSHAVKRLGPMPLAAACETARQVIAALTHAHQAGIFHRDLKPSNLFLTRDGTVKLLDLGLARTIVSSPLGEASFSTGRNIVGTPEYMAPEQWRADSRVDHRADWYALGATLVYLLTGRPPFPGPDLAALLHSHLNAAPPRLDAVRTDIDPALADIVDQLLNKNPDERLCNPDFAHNAFAPRANRRSLMAWMAAESPPIGVSSEATVAVSAKSAPEGAAAADHLAASAIAGAATPERPRRLSAIRFATLVFLLTFVVLSAIAGLVVATWPSPPRQNEDTAERELDDRNTRTVARLPSLGTWPLGTLKDASFSGIVLQPTPLENGGKWQVETRFARGGALMSRRIAWNPNGTRLLDAGAEGIVRLYEPDGDAYHLVGVERYSANPPLAVAWSPKGDRVAIGIQAHNQQLRVHDSQLRRQAVIDEGHGGVPCAIAFSPDGTALALATDRAVTLWDVAANTRRTQFLFSTPTAPPSSLAWIDASRLRVAFCDGSVAEWEVDSSAYREIAPPRSVYATDPAKPTLSPNGKRLAFATTQSSWRWVDLEKGDESPELVGGDRMAFSAAWNGDGTALAVAGASSIAPRIWSVPEGKLLDPGVTGDDYIAAMAWRPETSQVSMAMAHGGAAHGRLVARDVTARRVVNRQNSPDPGHPAAAFLSSSGKLVTVQGGGLRIWNAAEATCERRWSFLSKTPTIRYEAADAMLASRTGTDEIAVIGPGKRTYVGALDQERPRLELGSGDPCTIAISPDGRLLAEGHAWGTSALRIYDLATGERVDEISCPGMAVMALRWSPDGRWLAFKDNTWSFYDVRDRRQFNFRDDERARGYALAWIDNRQAAVIGRQTCEIWTMPPHASGTRSEVRGEYIFADAAADGKEVLLASEGMIRLWNPASKSIKNTLEPFHLKQIAFDRSGMWTVLGGVHGDWRAYHAGSEIPHWTAAALSNGRIAVFSAAGEVLFGDVGFERDLVYVVDDPDGKRALLTHEEFLKLPKRGRATP